MNTLVSLAGSTGHGEPEHQARENLDLRSHSASQDQCNLMWTRKKPDEMTPAGPPHWTGPGGTVSKVFLTFPPWEPTIHGTKANIQTSATPTKSSHIQSAPEAAVGRCIHWLFTQSSRTKKFQECQALCGSERHAWEECTTSVLRTDPG